MLMPVRSLLRNNQLNLLEARAPQWLNVLLQLKLVGCNDICNWDKLLTIDWSEILRNILKTWNCFYQHRKMAHKMHQTICPLSPMTGSQTARVHNITLQSSKMLSRVFITIFQPGANVFQFLDYFQNLFLKRLGSNVACVHKSRILYYEQPIYLDVNIQHACDWLHDSLQYPLCWLHCHLELNCLTFVTLNY